MYIPESEYKHILENIPILCVDLLIVHDHKCLLLKRDNEPAKGQYWFPGGRINKLETIKNAAVRKAKEETNLDCEFIKVISVGETIFIKNENMNTDIHTVNICCEMIPFSIAPLKLDKYHKDYIWVCKQSNSCHNAVNHPLSLMGFCNIETLNQDSQL